MVFPRRTDTRMTTARLTALFTIILDGVYAESIQHGHVAADRSIRCQFFVQKQTREINQYFCISEPPFSNIAPAADNTDLDSAQNPS